MIGAAVLLVGLLLIASGLVGARIPGGATFAPAGIDHVPGSDAQGSPDGTAGPGPLGFAFAAGRSSRTPKWARRCSNSRPQ